jgi:hypothetical protein
MANNELPALGIADTGLAHWEDFRRECSDLVRMDDTPVKVERSDLDYIGM